MERDEVAGHSAAAPTFEYLAASRGQAPGPLTQAASHKEIKKSVVLHCWGGGWLLRANALLLTSTRLVS